MKRLFIDSSVLYSAAYSLHGHSRDLILLGAHGEIVLIISPLVLAETHYNLAKHVHQVVDAYDRFIEHMPFEVMRPSRQQVIEATRQVFWKDAPIVASARRARVDYLVTLDRKHLLGKPEVARYAGVPIVTPKEAIAILGNTN